MHTYASIFVQFLSAPNVISASWKLAVSIQSHILPLVPIGFVIVFLPFHSVLLAAKGRRSFLFVACSLARPLFLYLLGWNSTFYRDLREACRSLSSQLYYLENSARESKSARVQTLHEMEVEPPVKIGLHNNSKG